MKLLYEQLKGSFSTGKIDISVYSKFLKNYGRKSEQKRTKNETLGIFSSRGVHKYTIIDMQILMVTHKTD